MNREADMGDSSQDDESPEFQKNLEIAKALSLETFVLDKIRRERISSFERVEHVSSLSVLQDQSNSSGRSSPVPLNNCQEDGSKRSLSGSNVSRPRPARKTSLPGTVLLPPPRPRRPVYGQSSSTSSAQANHRSDSPDLMSFAGSGASVCEKSDPEFDPLLNDFFGINKKIDHAVVNPSTVLVNVNPFTLEQLKSKPVIRHSVPSLPGPLPLSQWNFPPPLAPRGAKTAPIGRVSLSTVPPSPFQQMVKSDDLIDLSTFDGLRPLEDNGKLWRSNNDSCEIWKSFDPLHSQVIQEERRTKRPISGDYFKLWESGSDIGFKQEPGVPRKVEESAPQVPVRTHSVKEEKVVEDVCFEGVELRQNSSYASQSLATTRVRKNSKRVDV